MVSDIIGSIAGKLVMIALVPIVLGFINHQAKVSQAAKAHLAVAQEINRENVQVNDDLNSLREESDTRVKKQRETEHLLRVEVDSLKRKLSDVQKTDNVCNLGDMLPSDIL